MGPSTPTAEGFLTVSQAADRLGMKPWDVMRLIDSGVLDAVVLVQTTDVQALEEQS